MFIHTIGRRGLRSAACALLLTAAAALCLWRPQALATGVNRGLSVCSGVIIPTLYPFMILAGFLTETPLCRRPGRLCAALTRRLFGLPGCCGPAILISLVGGYPAGALAIGQLWRQGQIDRQQAQRMTRFCVNAGPGFIISTVGSGLLGSTRAGLLLFAAHITVSVGYGIGLGRGQRRTETGTPAALPPPRPVAQIVADACRSLLTMCGFVVLAAALLSLLEAAALPLRLQQLTGLPAARFSTAAAGLLEVSCGCIALAGCGDAAPFWLCLCMGWGGLSVQGQLSAALGDGRLLDGSFYLYRVLHGVASGLLALLLFRLIPAGLPTAVGTLGGGVAALPYPVTAAASGMLLVLSFLAMVCFSPKSTGKTE